ncbi:MAG TPA: tetratricopeptide repeat protein [Anaerolineae bacterium]|nr:tetratricopeptide repeat protein [Anaerolineae bacterium]
MSDDQTPEQSETPETNHEAPAAETRSGKKSKAEKRKAAALAQADEEAPASSPVQSEEAKPAESPAASVPADRSAAAPANNGGAAQDLFEQGVQALLRGEYDTAETHYGQALTLHRKAGNQAGQIAVLEQLGHLCFLRGAEAQAQDYYRQAGAMRTG